MTRMTRRVRMCVLVLGLLPALITGGTATAGNTARAKQLFRRAERLYAAGAYQDALQLYLEAFRNKPLVGFQFNIGQCYRQLDRCDLANHHFRKYVHESRSSKNRRTAQSLIVECERNLERKRERLAAEARAAAAQSSATPEDLVADSAAPQDEDAEDGASVAVQSAGRSDVKRLSPVWFWTGVGLTAAFALVTTITGALTIKYGSDYEDPGQTEEELLDIKETGEALRTAANVNFGLTLASAAATTVLFFLTDFHRGGEKTTLSAVPFRDGGLFALQGRF